MSKPAVANWNVELICTCPECGGIVDLMEASDFIDNHSGLIPLHYAKELWFTCPECGKGNRGRSVMSNKRTREILARLRAEHARQLRTIQFEDIFGRPAFRNGTGLEVGTFKVNGEIYLMARISIKCTREELANAINDYAGRLMACVDRAADEKEEEVK